MINKRLVSVIVLIIIASFFRLYRIGELTEFLGDQGRDGYVIHQLEKAKTLPEVGPSLSNGRFTGPFYYYLVAPAFILSHYDPVVPAVQMAVMGVISVLILYGISVSMFGFPIGYCIGFLYAISPLLVTQDRTLWNPTPIPLFVMVVFLSMYLISKGKYWALVMLLVADALLFQLHYVNGLTVMLSILYVVYGFYESVQKHSQKIYTMWLSGALLATGLISYRFLSYESTIGFRDIIGTIGSVSDTTGFIFSKRHYLDNIVMIGSDLMKYVLTIPWKIPLFVSVVCIMVINIVKRGFWSYFLVGWIVLATITMAFYKDTINAQYLYQLIPVTFLLFGNALVYLQKRYSAVLAVIIICTVGACMLYQTDIFSIGRNDIKKTKELTDIVIRMSDSKPFAFTLESALSHTDMHYRFFMDLLDVHPVSADSSDYGQFFLICDSGQCPTKKDMRERNKLYTVCSDIVCGLDHPILDLSKWDLDTTMQEGSSVIHRLVRKP